MKNYIQIKNSLAEVSENQCLELSSPLIYQTHTRKILKEKKKFLDNLTQWENSSAKIVNIRNQFIQSPQLSNYLKQPSITQRNHAIRKSLPKIQPYNDITPGQNRRGQIATTDRQKRIFKPQNPQRTYMYSTSSIGKRKISKNQNQISQILQISNKINTVSLRLAVPGRTRIKHPQFQSKNPFLNNSYEILKKIERRRRMQQLKSHQINNDQGNKIIKLNNLKVQIPQKDISPQVPEPKIEKQKIYQHKNILIKYIYKSQKVKSVSQRPQSDANAKVKT